MSGYCVRASSKRPLLQIEVLPLIQTKGQQLRVGVLPRKIMDDFLRVPAQHRIVAQAMFPHPLRGDGTVGEYLLAHRPIHRRILVGQQADQRFSLLLIQLG